MNTRTRGRWIGGGVASALAIACAVGAGGASAATQSDQQPQLSSSTICAGHSYKIAVPNLFPGDAGLYTYQTIDDGIPADGVPTSVDLGWVGENSSTFTGVWTPTKASTYHLTVTEVRSSTNASVTLKTLDVTVAAATIAGSGTGSAGLSCFVSNILGN